MPEHVQVTQDPKKGIPVKLEITRGTDAGQEQGEGIEPMDVMSIYTKVDPTSLIGTITYPRKDRLNYGSDACFAQYDPTDERSVEGDGATDVHHVFIVKSKTTDPDFNPGSVLWEMSIGFEDGSVATLTTEVDGGTKVSTWYPASIASASTNESAGNDV